MSATYQVIYGYASRYRQERPDVDLFGLMAHLIAVFGLCPWQAEEIAMDVIHGRRTE